MANTFKIFWTDSTSSIQGLVRFRWLALVCLFLGVFPLLQADYLQRNQLPYLIAVLALLSVFNGWSQGVSSKLTRQQEDRWLFVQLTVDLLAAASLLFVTGSANNPFIYVLCIHGFLGGMLLRSTKCFIFIGLIIALLSILQIETYQDARVTVGFDSRELSFHFLTQWILIFAAWFVAFLFSMLMQKQEEHIRRLQEKQWRSDRLKSLGALTAGFSHQLATPLNTLKLRLDRAHRKSSESAIQEELLEAQQALNECITIFHQMAGVFSNSTEGEPQQVKVKTLLQDIVKAWKQDNPQVKVESHFLEQDLACFVQPLAFSNTVFDLLDNAAEASGENSIISLRLFVENSNWILEVIDNGKGISQEVLLRLGEPFATDKAEGNGLGVYSAHMAAQSMGGEFELFNNSPHRGAIARLKIPLGETACDELC